MGATTTATAPPALAAFDRSSQLVLVGASVAALAAIVGVVLGARDLGPFGFAVIGLAIVAAGAAYGLEAMVISDTVKPWPPVAMLAAGAVATALAGLQVVEMIGDLDDMAEYGGFLGLIAGIVVLGASIAMLAGATRLTKPNLRPSERGAQLAGLGAGLVLLAWVLHLTIGFWAFSPASLGIAAVVLAAVLLLFGGTEARLLVWSAWIALALGLFAAWTAFGQWNALMDIGATRLELGVEDVLPFLAYVAGIVLVIGRALLVATGGRIAMPRIGTEAPPSADVA